MKKSIELGSEFSISLDNLSLVDDHVVSYFDKYNTIWFNYGRSAIQTINVPDDKITLLPEFMCDSVINCFSNIQFYKITPSFDIDIDDLLSRVNENVGCVYINHYFGYVQNKSVIEHIKFEIKKYGIVMIEDMTQSLFSINDLVGDFGVASVRKWMPTTMGGVLFTNKKSDLDGYHQKYKRSVDDEKFYGMVLKELYLKRGIDVNLEYRKIFEDAERRIDCSSNIEYISDLAYFLIQCCSVTELVNIRKNNVERLTNGLKKIGITGFRHFNSNECPLVLPLRVKNRDDFRKYLSENRVFCAVHWPWDGYRKSERFGAWENSQSLISLPIDQRYGEDDIDYMLDVIGSYGGDIVF